MTAAAAPGRAPRPRPALVPLFFNGAGRIGRATFLWTFPATVLAWRLYQDLPGRWAHLVLDWPVGLVTLASVSAVMSKRLHDFSLAGWWSAGVTGLYLVAVAGDAPSAPVQIAALIAAMGLAALLAAWPGERRFNRFGPPPQEASAPARPGP